MSCAKPKCRNKSEDPMVSCWLCYTLYHAKCVDLAARTADNLREDKGLRWCCKKCMAFDIEFFSFFKNTRDEFEEINKDLSTLMKKFSKYKDLLEKPPCSPKRKKSSNGSTLPENKTVNNNIVKDIINLTDNQQIMNPSVQNSPNVNCIHPEESSAPSSTNNSRTRDSETLNTPLPQTQAHSRPLNSELSTPINSVVPVNNPIQLKVISPKKTIFAARFASETTTETVVNYIKHKIGFDIDVLVFKFKYSEQRSKSSFKIIVPEENFDAIVSSDFWPPKAIVHEYIYKNNPSSNVVHLPIYDHISKN